MRCSFKNRTLKCQGKERKQRETAFQKFFSKQSHLFVSAHASSERSLQTSRSFHLMIQVVSFYQAHIQVT